jgi:hypothetical protein
MSALQYFKVGASDGTDYTMAAVLYFQAVTHVRCKAGRSACKK